MTVKRVRAIGTGILCVVFLPGVSVGAAAGGARMEEFRTEAKTILARPVDGGNALRELGPLGVPVLLRLAEEDHPRSDLIGMALDKLTDPAFADAFVQASRNPRASAWVETPLAAMREKRAVPLFEETVRRGTPGMRDTVAAAAALAAIHEERSLKLVLPLLESGDEPMRPELTRPAIAFALLEAGDARGRDIAIENLGMLIHYVELARLNLSNIKDPELERAALKLLRDEERNGEERASAALLLLKSGSARAREEARKLLSRVLQPFRLKAAGKEEEADELMMEFFDSPLFEDESSIFPVSLAMVRSGDFELISGMVRSGFYGDPGMEGMVFEALARLGTKEATELLLKIVEASPELKDAKDSGGSPLLRWPGHRLSAASALLRGGRDIPFDRLKKALSGIALEDADALQREQMNGLLRRTELRGKWEKH